MTDEQFSRDIRNGFIISLLAGIGWLTFIIIHAFLWSPNFTFFQNSVIGIFSFLGVGALVSLIWMAGAAKYREQMEEFCELEI